MADTSAIFEAAVHATTEVADNEEEPEDTRMLKIARSFLSKACPDFLAAVNPTETPKQGTSAFDRVMKVGRNVAATVTYANKVSGDKRKTDKAHAALALLVEECANLTNILKETETRRVPKVRYGKTELQISVVTLGCMRFQQSWNRASANAPITEISQVDEDCQSNLVNILKYAIRMGVNHIETAKGYGCSEMQIGHALDLLFKEGFVKREDLIIQTKGSVIADFTVDTYRQDVLDQIKRLKLDYVDLFSVHGLNSENDLKYLFNNDPAKGNLIEALKRLQQEGKIRHIGFSTHAPADLIRRAIESDAFAYVNLHYHFVGSYTASGDHDFMAATKHGNGANIALARQKDMGVFIISPFDKGGRLYAPSVKLRELTLPEMEPMTFGCFWLWQQDQNSSNPRGDTIVCGAARPSDLDQPILASFQMLDGQTAAKTDLVDKRLREHMEKALPGGKQWVDTWHVGVLNGWHAKYGTQHGNMVWLYNLINAFGLLEFAKERYVTLAARTEKWDGSKPADAQFGGAWCWVPGTGFDANLDYSEDFSKCPPENQAQLKEAIAFVHKWCRPKSEETHPFEWETALDMRPWTAFPERS